MPRLGDIVSFRNKLPATRPGKSVIEGGVLW